MIPTYALLALAVVCLWLGGNSRLGCWIHARLWLVVAAASLGAALVSGVVAPVGLLTIGVFAALVLWFARAPRSGWQPAVAAAGVIVLAAGLMMHRLPGFHNARVISAVRFSADAVPFSLHLNYDKTLVGLFILGWLHARITRWTEWRSTLRVTAPRALALVALLLVPALAAGYVRWDPKFPDETWLWMAGNLLFTCTAEEALFRGFIQAGLQRWWSGIAHGRWLALVAAAALFGVAHAGGGIIYVALSTLAGIGYGWVYQRTQRIEASVLTHFAVNAVHFLLFTYPALQRV